MRPKGEHSPARSASRRVGAAAVCVLLALASTTIPVVAQEAATRVSGSVVDATTRQPLANVSVQVQGTSLGAVTDAAGRYELAVRLGAGDRKSVV